MNNIQIDIRLEGERFSPAKLMQLTQIPLEILAEAGQPGKRGRFKGVPSPYGMALWRVEKTKGKGDIQDSLIINLNRLLQLKKEIEELGVEEIIVDIDAAKEISLNKEILTAVSELNANIDININHEPEYDQAIHDIIEYIAGQIQDDENAKAILYSEKVNEVIKTMLNEDKHLIKQNRNYAFRYLLYYLLEKEVNESIALENIAEVLKSKSTN